MEKILEFYRRPSLYTDLGCYKEFARALPDDINELCMLQRMQIIHPIVLKDEGVRNSKASFWGDMTKISAARFDFEDELFPAAIGMLNELLRKNSNYTTDRAAEDKIHVTCRGQAVLLAAVLKVKGYPARVRSGFAPYIRYDGINYDHWVTEYYNEDEERWVIVDADIHCCEHELDFDDNDIPRDKYIFGAEAYLGMRNKSFQDGEIYYASVPATLGMKAALRALFYDYHCLMGDEVLFNNVPRYLEDKGFDLAEEEYLELDRLARMMLFPDENFDKLLDIWNSELKYRIMCGVLN